MKMSPSILQPVVFQSMYREENQLWLQGIYVRMFLCYLLSFLHRRLKMTISKIHYLVYLTELLDLPSGQNVIPLKQS